MKKKKPPIIQISFKDDELDLYYRIETRCKLAGKSGWLKEAALEKLEREDNPQLYNNVIYSPNPMIMNNQIQSELPIKQEGLDNMLSMLDIG